MTRVLIVGAGPAGIRAAEALVAAGLRPVVVDEGARAGGQIYRRPPEGFTRPPEVLYGTEAAKARTLHATFDGLVASGAVTHHPRSSVVALAGGFAHLSTPAGALRIGYDKLILATGAVDRVAPVPGWQMGGVFTLGAAQIALKTQGAALGRRLVLAGSGPLLTLVASQLVHAGAEVAAVLDSAPLAVQAKGALSMAAARPAVTLRGLRMRASLGGRYHAGVRLEAIEGGLDGPAAVVWCKGRGPARRTACDTVALGWHLRAETHLADLAGARFAWSATFAQWLPRTDAAGRAEGVPDLYLAGDGLTLQGADSAEIAGRLAAGACLQDLGLRPGVKARDLRAYRRMARFAAGIAQSFPWPSDMVRALPDDAVLCRCEGVTAGALRATIPQSGAEVNRAKALARVGMGRCQGRYCQLAGAEVIAAAAGIEPAAAGRLRGQPPVRPLSVAGQIRPREEESGDRGGDTAQPSA